ncbi:hypothetical protein BH11PSE2_BH11PSE2_17180 [soil metagenome]
MITLPQFPIEGGCGCGALRYRLNEAPRFIYTCHCTDCQALSTSAFTLNMPINFAALEVIQGELKMWIRTTGSGAEIPQYVCTHCGVRIYSHHPARSDIATLRCGTLDDTTWIVPTAAIWMKSAQPWVRMPDDCILFDVGFTDTAPVVTAWKAQTGLA